MAGNRMMVRLIVAIAAVGGVAVVSSLSPTQFDTAQAQPNPNPTVTVSIAQGATGKGPQAYGQNPLRINIGTTVLWVNNDNVAHSVTSDTPGQFDSGFKMPGQSFQYTFSTVGAFPYHCSIHGQQSMSGTVQVNAGGGAGAAGAGGGSSGGPGPMISPSSGPMVTPSSGPVIVAGYTCDAQGTCCNANGCVPSNHFTCDKTGWCCQDDGSNCSFNFECSNGYCCDKAGLGHCGMSTYGSGEAHCVPRNIVSGDLCCDAHGTCDGGFSNCNGLQCCNSAGKCIPQTGTYQDPRPGASPSPSPSPSHSPSPAPSASPGALPSSSPSGASSSTPSGTSSGAPSGGAPSGGASGSPNSGM